MLLLLLLLPQLSSDCLPCWHIEFKLFDWTRRASPAPLSSSSSSTLARCCWETLVRNVKTFGIKIKRKIKKLLITLKQLLQIFQGPNLVHDYCLIEIVPPVPETTVGRASHHILWQKLSYRRSRRRTFLKPNIMWIRNFPFEFLVNVLECKYQLQLIIHSLPGTQTVGSYLLGIPITIQEGGGG